MAKIYDIKHVILGVVVGALLSLVGYMIGVVLLVLGISSVAVATAVHNATTTQYSSIVTSTVFSLPFLFAIIMFVLGLAGGIYYSYSRDEEKENATTTK